MFQNQRECWASTKNDYDKHGKSTACKDGKGAAWAFNAYQIP